jgi:hypothetical protein
LDFSAASNLRRDFFPLLFRELIHLI